MHETPETLSTLLNNLPGMAYRCRNDAAWTMEYVSAGSYDLTGYSPQDLVGNRKIAYADLIHPEDRPRVWEEVQAALRAREPFQLVYRLTTAAGAEKWVWEQGRGIYTAAGRPSTLEGFVTDLSEHVAIRQTLEQRVNERTRQLATLLEVSHNVVSTLELEPLLGLILDQLKSVVAYSGASILLLSPDRLRVLAYRGPIPQAKALQIAFPLAEAGANRLVIQHREPLIIPDVRGKSSLARAFQQTAGDQFTTTFQYVRAWMGVPLIAKDRVVGMLSLDHTEPGYYTDADSVLVMAFAAQVAVAIENAQLYAQAQQAAALKERHRLARELHDSVTQTLFSASLIAEVLPRIWERNAAQGRRRLRELRELTRGALAEMRTLLLELRPATLTETSLDELLRQLSEAIIGRARLPIDLTITGAPRPLPPEVQVALYRIAQEALNNTVKHAGAGRVTVALEYGPAGVRLAIRDDGRGFDPAALAPNSLGLGIMRERAGKIGATLEIESRVGEGTAVTAVWQSGDENVF